ncbi:hypothetical protein L1987_78970 [Smallanthus sonchifolius]|uniref:Uncharacterized protein n=1 Tax=Smallanthus sonchifolius TaxID=185202 RepID=A0ACB8ZF60_9ASTR|nr:hypothetical protein L1987_78970 [Smallanthus sonchifolius]
MTRRKTRRKKTVRRMGLPAMVKLAPLVLMVLERESGGVCYLKGAMVKLAPDRLRFPLLQFHPFLEFQLLKTCSENPELGFGRRKRRKGSGMFGEEDGVRWVVLRININLNLICAYGN